VSLKTPLLIGLSAAAVVGLSCLAAVKSLHYSLASVQQSGNSIRILLFVDNPLDRTFIQRSFYGVIGINGSQAGVIADCSDRCIYPCGRTEFIYEVPVDPGYNPNPDFVITEGRPAARTKIFILGNVYVGRLRIPVSLSTIAV